MPNISVLLHVLIQERYALEGTKITEIIGVARLATRQKGDLNAWSECRLILRLNGNIIHNRLHTLYWTGNLLSPILILQSRGHATETVLSTVLTLICVIVLSGPSVARSVFTAVVIAASSV